MKIFFIFTLIVLLIHQSLTRVIENDVQNVWAEDKVNVTIYYENLNKANRKFFIEEFKPVLDNLFEIIDIELVPYGNTNKTSDNVFECPFGEKQCFANRVQACAINLTNVDDPAQQRALAHFTYCIFKNKEYMDIYKLGPFCANQDFLDEWPEIEICNIMPGVGDQIYSDMGQKTAQVQSSLVNGLAVQINSVISADATQNLVKAVCDAYQPSNGLKPERCNNTVKAPKIKVEIFYDTLNIVTQNYFSRQIKPMYHLIEDIVDIDLIPYGNTEYDDSNGNNNFNCSSPQKCISNRIQALVVYDFLINGPNGDEIDGPSRAINFIACASSHPQWQNIYRAGEQCSNLNLPPDDWVHLLINATTSDSDEVFLIMKQKTDSVGSTPLPRIPFVRINGEPSIPTLNDFLQEVCARYTVCPEVITIVEEINMILSKNLKGIKPSLCTRVDVVVFYESLNHKSRKFIIEELRPAFNHFQNLINLQLLPAGRAEGDNHGGFTCPGGVDQCDGNILQACTIDWFWNDGSNWTDPIRQEVMEFLYCMSKNLHAVGVWSAAEQCAQSTIELDPWPTIWGCSQNEGIGIFDDYIEITHSSGIDFNQTTIPVVTINGNVSESAVNDLIDTLCRQYDIDHQPDICETGKAPKLNVDVYYESMSQLSKNFFTKQMGPYYKFIEEMVDLQLYPNGNVDDGNNTQGQCPNKLPACVANQIQAVVIDQLWLHDDDGDQIDGSIRTTQFLSCVFNHSDWDSDYMKAGEDCANQYLPNDDWFEIIVEINTPGGQQIYQKVQNKTKELKDQIGSNELSPIPYVNLNGRHSLRTANDLLQSVCESYTGGKPLECTPVVVEVYYETLNAQTRRFFLEELRPTFEHIRESFTLDYIPFGRTNTSGTGNDTIYNCPNGEQQCIGNKIQACAVKFFLHDDEEEISHQVDGKNQTLLFIYCMFKNVDIDEDINEVAEKCANQYLLEDVWAWNIKPCVESDNQIMQLMAERTLSLPQPLQHSPWIVINGQRSALAQTQLQTVVCDNLLGNLPDACLVQRAPKVKIEFNYQTGDTSVKNYFTQELYPSYRDIEEIIDLEIVPFGQTVVVRGDDGNYTFTCPNGPNECIGNKIHACVYEYYWHNDDEAISDNMDIDGKLQTLQFINCYFTNDYWPNDPFRAGEQCINQIFIDMWPTIDQCVTSGQIDGFLAQLGEKVAALFPPLLYTPWITVNDRHSKAAELHFTRAICDAYTGTEKPWACYADLPPIQKPTVDIHYEPLNTDCQSFVVSQLDHIKTHIDEITSINLLPYGRTTTNGSGFDCPNDNSCHTYKQHACIMDRYLYNHTIETLNFLVCAFGSNMNSASVTEECLNENFVDVFPTIDLCAHSEGDQLLQNLAEQVATLDPPLSHVPWILVNGEHNVDAEDNLIQEICDYYYPTDKPSQCIPELLSVSINYQTNDSSVSDFYEQQFKPLQYYFEEFASFDFVPYGLTQRNGNGFTCPDSTDQCNANKIHTCVLHNFYDKENHTNTEDIEDSRYKTIGFLICAFNRNSSNPISDAESCLNENIGHDYWPMIDMCAHGPDGTQLYDIMAQKTEALQPPLTKVPWVTINNTYSVDADTNLIQTICQSYPSVRPSLCSSLGTPKVGLGVYYSSDQNGRDWVVNQLKPFYSDSTPTRAQSLQSLLSTSFIPWGNTSYTAGADDPFSCPNGPNECLANKIHACAIDQYSSAPKGWLQITEFIICFFSHNDWNSDPSEAGNQCANKVWFLDPWPTLEVCATFNNDTYLKMKALTEQANPDHFPWITVNNKQSTEAETDLLGTVCDNYPGLKPDACSSQQSPTPSSSPPTGSSQPSSGTSEVSTTLLPSSSSSPSSQPSTGSSQSSSGSSDLTTTLLPSSSSSETSSATSQSSTGSTQSSSIGPTGGPSNKVKVTIYYENLNKANRKFFIEEFKPVLDNLFEIIDIELVPYGNTNKTSDNVFECPFGEKQCFANRVQACAINLTNVDDPAQQRALAHFTYCIFKNKEYMDIYKLGPFCANQDFLDEWPEIEICNIMPGVGDQIYSDMGQKTAQVQSSLVNGLAVQINSVISPDATQNLVKAVCDAYQPSNGLKPERCNNTVKAPKIKVEIFYDTLNIVTQNYFSQQIKPMYHLIEDIVDIDLIPYGNTEYDDSNGNNNFNCSSPQKCISNRIQALVVYDFLINGPNGDEIDGPSRAINFIACASSHPQWQNIYRAGEQCSNLNLPPDDWVRLLINATTSDSDEVFLIMKQKTDSVGSTPLPRIPFVRINGEPSIPTLNDFLQEVCARYTVCPEVIAIVEEINLILSKNLKGIKPSLCTRVDVVVFYESLNHKSRKFIIEELRPAFNYFQNLINLQLLPAGRAEGDNHGGFTCPGGVDQCDGNILQACTIDWFWNDGSNWTDPIRQEVMEFLYCMSKNLHAVGVWSAAEQCAQSTIELDPWPTIWGCSQNEGIGIFDDYIEITHSSGIDFNQTTIPVVTINGNVSESAVNDLIDTLCRQYDIDHQPDICETGKAPKLNVDVYYESMSQLSKNFFTKQMGPYYKFIEEMVDLQLYPNGNVDDGNNTQGQCPNKLPACVANQIQAVVIDQLWLHDDDGDQIDGSIRTTQFLSCVFNHSDWDSDYMKAGEDCANQYLPNDDWFEIIVEINTPGGQQIYQKVQNKTKELKDQIGSNELSPIPYVNLDGRHSLRTANDLLQSICESYTGEKPLECTPVVVEVYYETLNAQTRRFFLEELRPTFEHIRESFTLDYIPFGRTNTSGTGNDTIYNCPNGEQQCIGNKIQACAVKFFLHDDEEEISHQVDGKNQTLLFIYCMFKNVDIDEDINEVAEKCANQYLLEDVWAWNIKPCVESDNQIMQLMAERTLSLPQPLQHSPWIIINGQRSALAQTQLQTVVCDNLLGNLPDACLVQRAPKVKIEFNYQTGDTSVKNYFTQELYPSYRDIEEIIDLEIVPFGQTVVVRGDDGNYTFTCPNGPNECIGNKIHACVYEYYWHNDDEAISDNMDIDGKLQTLQFINCYFTNDYWPNDPFRAGEQCINQIFIDMWPTIDQCVTSGQIDGFLAQLGEKVAALFPPLLYTPWITVNDRHSKAAELHFTRAICDAYTGTEKPWACYADLPPIQKPTVAIHYEPLNTDCQSFVVSQLDHIKTHIDEITSINLLPYGRTTNNGSAFNCPNDNSCHTYKQHACIMDRYLYNHTIETLNFLVCAFGSNMNSASVTEECLNENFVDVFPTIDLCAHSEGDQLLQNLAEQVATLDPPLSHVPWILVNGEHNVDAEDNLIQEICDYYYPTDKPSQCIPELLSVSINYQTNDSSVSDFYEQQFKPLQYYFEEFASFDFVPYGLTQRNGNGFTCPDSTDQCNANKIHTCVLHNFYDKENHTNTEDIEDSRYKTIGFLICAFNRNSSNPISDAESCLNENIGHDYWPMIDMCAHGPDGTQLYDIMAQKTEALQPPLTKVPWVTINNTYSVDADTNLIQTICQSYPSVRPSLCSSLGTPKVGLGVYYSSDQNGRDWVVNQLKPFYSDSTPTRAQSLQSLLSTSFIPWGNTSYTAGADDPFSCPNGPNECLANKIHACAIDQYSSAPKGWLQITEFIICFFSHNDWNSDPSEAGNQCANKVWFLDPWPTLEVCATFNNDTYLKMKALTEQANPDHFPWITVNNKQSTEAETDLLGTVCDNYPGLKPDACSSQQSPTPSSSPPSSTSSVSSTTSPESSTSSVSSTSSSESSTSSSESSTSSVSSTSSSESSTSSVSSTSSSESSTSSVSSTSSSSSVSSTSSESSTSSVSSSSQGSSTISESSTGSSLPTSTLTVTASSQTPSGSSPQSTISTSPPTTQSTTTEPNSSPLSVTLANSLFFIMSLILLF